jgi:hypothetical protein
MSHDYDAAMFGSNDAATNTSDDDEEPFEVRKWRLGDHAARPTVDRDTLSVDAAKTRGVDDELADLLDAAAARVPDFSLYDFECAKCGLGHGHGDTKHDIRSGFNVRPGFAELMEFAPNCHCGVNELAMLLDFYEHIQTRVFTDGEQFAPVKSIPSGAVADIRAAIREAEHDEDRATPTVRDAARQTDHFRRLSGEQLDALAAFFDRADGVRAAAGNADIADTTAERIETVRESLAAEYGPNSDDDDDDAPSSPGTMHRGP